MNEYMTIYRSIGLCRPFTFVEIEDGYEVYIEKDDGDIFLGLKDSIEKAESLAKEMDEAITRYEDDHWFIFS